MTGMLAALLLAASAEAPAILLEREVSPALDESRIAKGLDALTDSARKRLEGVADPAKRLEALMKCLTQEHGYTPDPAGASLQEFSLSRVLARGRGAGETLAVIYWALAERLGIRLSPVYAPDRLLLRWEEGGVKITVDAADKSVGLTDAAYRKKLGLPEQGPYLDPLTLEGVEAFLRRRRAEVLLAAGRREDALADARKALDLDPSRPEHHLALARTLWALADAPGAKKALASAGASAEALLLSADLALASDADPQAAGELLDRAVGEAPSDALKSRAHAARAGLRAFLGRRDLARADLDRALALGPADPALLAARERLILDAELSAAWGRKASAPVSLDPRAEVASLLAGVRSPDEKAREEAKRRLAEMGARAVPTVKEALRGADRAARLGALLFLAGSPNASCLEEILACASAPEAELRLAALSTLGELGEKDEPSRAGVLERARAMLAGDAEAEVRRRAATVLARFRDPAAVAHFRKALEDPDDANRMQAALALGRLEDRESLPLLRKTLADAAPRVRFRAAQALGLLGDEAAVPDLIQALKDESRDVRDGALEALKGITKEDWGTDAAKWDDWWRSRTP